MPIHLFCEVQIELLLAEEAPIKVLLKYSDYADIFSFDLAMELPENTGMKEYSIKLIKGKQPLYGIIYSLKAIELKTWKTYIKTHLKTGFIRPSKSPASASIFFDQK